MALSRENLKGKKVEFLNSETESEIQLLLIPGVMNSDIWRHQINYFSRKYSVLAFESDGGRFEDDYRIVKSILDQKQMDNTVLVSSNLGNTLVQRAETHENVIGSILTGTLKESPREFSRAVYNLFWKAGFSHPKMTKKIFFSDKARYSAVKEFVNEVQKPEYERFISYIQNYSLRKPSQDCLIINSSEDRFASNAVARELQPEARLSNIENSGTFCQYEKPEEYNKAVHDFLRKIEDFVESKKVRKTREKNRTLNDFSADETIKEVDDGDSDREHPVLRQ